MHLLEGHPSPRLVDLREQVGAGAIKVYKTLQFKPLYNKGENGIYNLAGLICYPPLFNLDPIFEPGWVKSSRRHKEIGEYQTHVSEGAHLFFDKEKAEDYAAGSPYEYVFECWVLIDDIVATCGSKLVVMKYYISEMSWLENLDKEITRHESQLA